MWLQTEYTGCQMHIVIAGVHFNHHAITFSKFANWCPAYFQPLGLINSNTRIFDRASKFRTIAYLVVEPLVEHLNGRDHDNSAWFTMQSGSMGCPPPRRQTIFEMWSQRSEHSHRIFSFCHNRFRAILTLAWRNYIGMYSGHAIELTLEGWPLTMAFMAPFPPSGPVQPSLCGGSCRSPICQSGSWILVFCP